MTLKERIQELSPKQRATLMERLAGNINEQNVQLVAYVRMQRGAAMDEGVLRKHLEQELPEFMIPSRFVALDTFPTTPNGKIDRVALPEPAEAAAGGGADRTMPRNDIERQLAAVWSELLRIPQPGIHENFFQLGGHSLLALQLLTRVRAAFRVNLPLRRFFDAPTVAGLAEAVGRAPKNDGIPRRRSAREQNGASIGQISKTS